jgi:hypothetical protein
MAATLIQTFERARDVRRVKYAVTSHTDGIASVAFVHLSGLVVERVEVVPDLSTDQPTAAFALTLSDEAGIDLLDGAGADRPNDGPSMIEPKCRPCLVLGNLTLALSGMGSGKKCEVYIYARPAV